MKPLLMILPFLMNIAAAQTLKHAPLDSDYAVETQNAREKNMHVWMPVLDSRIELVKNNKVEEEFQSYTNEIQDAINLESLKTLQIRDVYVDQSRVSITESVIKIPFVASVRYEESLLKQGTLNTSGVITLKNESDVITVVDLVYFSDSQILEEYGRNLGILDAYGAEFLVNVSSSILLDHFSNQKLLNKILAVSSIYKKENATQILF
ncbi:MAG: hypothetical protein CME64_04890 [Halobacteriovoraceae bacterium]|nr:hypothetical protein [Halobacteriovoraceae bacterium]|tara:strand:- start:360009 stop:360632 length:624 start_codon:yes stop_codon:yes gene_type:complete